MKPRITPNTSFIAIAVLLLCAVENSARAATITVTNTNDSGAGSLRQALTDALDGDTINFAVTGTIGLTGGELLVNKSVTISGPGAGSLTVDGNANSRVFHIGSDKTVSIFGLTITDGNASGNYPDDRGAGIYNDHATLTLSNCTISGNSAAGIGGGTYNDNAILTLNNCTIASNSAGFGSGIFNDGFAGSATLQINNSTISSNAAINNGGGVYNDGSQGGNASLTINSSTLSANSARYGGGILNDGFDSGSAVLAISNSTLNGNSADNSGGGVFNYGFAGSAALQLSNSTLSSNSANFSGGGIYSTGEQGGNATLQLSNSTLSGNSAGSDGGAISNVFAAVQISNSILNAGAAGGNIFSDSGTITSLGYNLSSDDGGGFLTGSGDQINTNPMLGPLQNNGGPTFTNELLSGSPAIDAGDPNFTPPPFFDQRGPGFDRVVNGRIDSGSFEVQGPTPTPITLSAHRRRVQGRHTVDLSWTGATSADIDIYRDGAVIATVPNNGAYKDFIGVRGGNIRYIYKVCDAGTQNCSNQVTVRFGGASAGSVATEDWSATHAKERQTFRRQTSALLREY
jgi:hypothetical protein